MSKYIINGAPRAGKDTFCEFLTEKVSLCYTLSIIDDVKDIAKFCGWNGGKTPKDRAFLSNLKDLLTAYNEFPAISLIKKIENITKKLKSVGIEEDDIVFLIIAREPSDIYALSQILGCKTVIIRNESAESAPASNHADAEILDYTYDISIDNNGDLENLNNEVERFIIEENLNRRVSK